MANRGGLRSERERIVMSVEEYVVLGEIVLAAFGADACQSGYKTADPEYVGRYALAYGDITKDGELT